MPLKHATVTITLQRKSVEEMLSWVPDKHVFMHPEQRELYNAMKEALNG